MIAYKNAIYVVLSVAKMNFASWKENLEIKGPQKMNFAH